MQIKTSNPEVVKYVRSLSSVSVTEDRIKDFTTIYLLYVHAKSAIEFSVALVTLIKFIKANEKHTNSTTTINIKPSECTPEIVEIVKASKGVVNVNIQN